MGQRLDDFPELRRSLLLELRRGARAIAVLARTLQVTGEGVRQQLAALERDGWVRRRLGGRRKGAVGRPVRLYELTRAAEELFPKAYDALAVELLDAVADRVGPKALENILEALVAARVGRLEPALRGLPLEDRLEKLRELYLHDDPFISVERKDGELRLVERNCPFFAVASQRPALCSVTVNALSRLLGCRVERVERFQSGHGHCAFVVRPRQKAPGRFRFE